MIQWNKIPAGKDDVLMVDTRGEWVGTLEWVARLGRAVCDMIVWEQCRTSTEERRQYIQALFPKVSVSAPDNDQFSNLERKAQERDLRLVRWERQPWVDDDGRRIYKPHLDGDDAQLFAGRIVAALGGDPLLLGEDEARAIAVEQSVYINDRYVDAFGLEFIYALPYKAPTEDSKPLNLAQDAETAYESTVFVALMLPPEPESPQIVLDFSAPESAA